MAKLIVYCSKCETKQIEMSSSAIQEDLNISLEEFKLETTKEKLPIYLSEVKMRCLNCKKNKGKLE